MTDTQDTITPEPRIWTVALRRRGNPVFEIMHDLTLQDVCKLDLTNAVCVVMTLPEPEADERIPF